MYLVIEVTDGLTSKECDDFAKKFKAEPPTATPLDATVAHKVVSVLVLPLPACGIQYYDAEKLHNRPHYIGKRATNHWGRGRRLLHRAMLPT